MQPEPDHTKEVKKTIILLPFIVYLLSYLLLLIPDTEPIISYSIVYIAVSLNFILLSVYIFKTDLPEKYVYFLLVCGIVLRIFMMFIYPTGSDDFYRYIWDGKVMANGINPYKYVPADDALVNLHSEMLPGLINFPELKSVYPPLSLIFFYLGYLIGGETFWGIKILLILSELLVLWGLFLILKNLKTKLKNILLYALAPLPLFQLSIDAHVDGLGLPFLIFAVYLYLKSRNDQSLQWNSSLIASLILIGFSICIKPVGLMLIPLLFLNEKGIINKAKTIIIPASVIVLIYLPFIFSADVFEALTDFTINWTFNGFVFEILDSFLNDNQKSRLICGIIFVLVYAVIIFSKKDFLNKIYLSLFLLFMFSPVVHQWYVIWLAVLLPFIPRWSGILYTTLISLTVFTVINYQLYGVWKNYPLVMILEYVPVLILFGNEMLFRKFSRGSTG